MVTLNLRNKINLHSIIFMCFEYLFSVFQLMTEDPDRMAKTRVDFYIREGDPDALFGIHSNPKRSQ